MKLLVTGGGGYIGSVASYLLLQSGYELVVIDNYSKGFRQPLEILTKDFEKKKFRYYKSDLSELHTIFNKEKNFDAVIHYAAFCDVNESIENPQKYFSNNVCGSQTLLEQMIDNGIDKLVFSSTSEVYGEARYMPIDEKHATSPINPYGASKLMVEDIIRWYGKLKNLNYVILRYFNVCGASDDGLIGDSKKPSTLLVQNVVRGALGIEKFYLTCPKVETYDKTPIRDYINVVDLNLAHMKSLNYLIEGGQSNIFNLGTGSGNSVLEIVRSVEKVTGKKINRKWGKTRKGEPIKKIANIKKANTVLKWRPERTIEDSIESLVKWYSKYPKGWKR